LQASVQLTAVAIPAQDMGRRAVELVMAKIEGREPESLTLLPPLLTERASTGPAPAVS
jgi:DNA-binding LacI/PurR family transcriptional regulator